MKITTGTDIIEIKRIQESIEKLKEQFLNKIFTQREIEYCESFNINKYQHYAVRFAAKEAIYKALYGVFEKDQLAWQNFEILNTKNGAKPQVKFKR